MHRFRASLYKIGILRCVDVPAAVSLGLGGGRVPVRGEPHGVAFRSTLAPRGEGRHRLYVHSRIWRPLGLDAGDRIAITLRRDHEPRPMLLPADLRRALDDDASARAALAAAPPGLRRE